MRSLLSALVAVLCTAVSFSQVTIGTNNPPDPAAVLDLQSTTKGFLLPRLTTTQRNAIVSPPQGLQIFNTTTECLEAYFNVGWKAVACACVTPPAPPQSIAGSANVCLNQQSVSYTIQPVIGATSYNWTVPNGATVASGQGTTSVTVNFGSSSGNVTVTAVNGCGVSSPTTLAITVANPNPGFTYNPNVISIGSNITFTPTTTGVGYQWTFPGGNPATSTNQSPVVTWANTGNYTVKLKVIANNNCMDSSTQNITVINCPPGSTTFSYSGTIQTFTVPNCVTTIHIDARGAQGGDNLGLVGQNLGGKGARVEGDFTVTPGATLNIVVGQRGINATSGNTANGGGGGGGGSFVWVSGQTAFPLAAAGGGGGSSLTNNGIPHYYGKDGVVTNNGGGSRSHDQFTDAPGGIAGADGYGGTAGGKGWTSIVSNPAGKTASSYGGNGGYGGGGGGGANCCSNPAHAAGAGGGYSGGGAGGTTYYYGGGGGGSYNSGANPVNTAGFQTGNGQVTISW